MLANKIALKKKIQFYLLGVKRWDPKSIHHSAIPNVYMKHLAQCSAVRGPNRRAVKSTSFGARTTSLLNSYVAFGKVTFHKCLSILFPHLAPLPPRHSFFREL